MDPRLFTRRESQAQTESQTGSPPRSGSRSDRKSSVNAPSSRLSLAESRTTPRDSLVFENLVDKESVALLQPSDQLVLDLQASLPLNLNRFESIQGNLQALTSRTEETVHRIQRQQKQEIANRLLNSSVLSSPRLPPKRGTSFTSLKSTAEMLKMKPTPPANPPTVSARAPSLGSSLNPSSARASAFMTEVEIAEKADATKANDPEREIEKSRYPGFQSSGVTALPFPEELSPVLESVASMNSFSNPRIRAAWVELIMSKQTTNIMHDLFWWMMCHLYQHDKAAQEKMFSRIAANFVAIFLRTDPKWKDDLLSKYHEGLAYAIYKIFIATYTKSVRHFGDEFKQQICHVVYEWFTGLKPTSEVWQSWDSPVSKSHASDDQSIMTFDRRSSIANPRPPSSGSYPDDASDPKLPRIPRVPKLKLNKVESNIIPTEGGQSSSRRLRVMFDLYGHSPLINYYLSKTCRPPGKVTYRQFTERSMNVNQRVYQVYTKARNELEREKVRIRKEGVLEKRYLEKEMKEVLRRQRDLHHYSDQLLHIHQAESDEVPEVIQDPRAPEERNTSSEKK